MSEDNPRPYQVCLFCGTNPPQIDNVKVVDVTPGSSSPDDVVARLTEVELTPADMRARVLFAVDATSDADEIRRAVTTYAAWVGFAGRVLDVACGTDVVVAADLAAAVSELEVGARPEVNLEQVQIGADRDDDLMVVGGSGLDADTVAALRWSRRVRMVPAHDVAAALVAFLTVATLRRRGDAERFPYLVVGDEPAELASGEVPGVCLDDVRRRSQEVRRSRRGGNRDALVAVAPLDPRRRKLLAASAVEITETLSRLGATADPDTELWHCPRPSRHTNGDANASMKASEGRVKCFRCDAERVDSLRLVMDSLGLTVDEAADWLLSDAAFATPVS